MTGLLVSVRSCREASLALSAGADIIDVKEPRYGSLGAATPRVWSAVRRQVGPQCRLSVALGELTDSRSARRAARAEGFHYAKLGLAGALSLGDWRERWQHIVAQLPSNVAPVTVLYADWQLAGAPHTSQVLSWGAAIGCTTVLIDTWCKERGDLFRNITHRDLCEIIDIVRSQQQQLVLAGSLRNASLLRALQFAPDYVAVRGAVCIGGRDGQLCAERVRGLSRRVHTNCSAQRFGS